MLLDKQLIVVRLDVVRSLSTYAHKIIYYNRGPPRGKRDGVIGHISERENGNWMEIIALLRNRSIWHPA